MQILRASELTAAAGQEAQAPLDPISGPLRLEAYVNNGSTPYGGVSSGAALVFISEWIGWIRRHCVRPIGSAAWDKMAP